MKKRTYHAKNVKQVNWDHLGVVFQGGNLVLGLDVAKVEQLDLYTHKEFNFGYFEG